MYRHGRSLISLFASKSGSRRYDLPLSASQAPKPFSGTPGGFEYLENDVLCSKSSVSGTNPGWMKLKENFLAPYSLNFRNYSSGGRSFDAGSYSKSMNFVRGALEEDELSLGYEIPFHDVEKDADIVHIKIRRNNTFVTVTDSKGNKKCGASAGCLPGNKSGRNSADAVAEHVGRLSKEIGVKSVIVKVNGLAHFKKKKQAVLSWRDGYNQSQVEGTCPIISIEDTTRHPHNGCRLPKRRRT